MAGQLFDEAAVARRLGLAARPDDQSRQELRDVVLGWAEQLDCGDPAVRTTGQLFVSLMVVGVRPGGVGSVHMLAQIPLTADILIGDSAGVLATGAPGERTWQVAATALVRLDLVEGRAVELWVDGDDEAPWGALADCPPRLRRWLEQTRDQLEQLVLREHLGLARRAAADAMVQEIHTQVAVAVANLNDMGRTMHHALELWAGGSGQAQASATIASLAEGWSGTPAELWQAAVRISRDGAGTAEA